MKKMKRLLVVGCFGDKTGRLDGQIVKTRNIFAMLQDRLDDSFRLDSFNTLSIRRKKILLISLLYKLICSDTVLLIPADRSLERFFPVLFRLSKIIHYDIIQLCVGGWLVDFFMGRGKWKPHLTQMEMSKQCKAFLPEIEKVNYELKNICKFGNCEVFPNFRRHIPEVVHINQTEQLRLVWLARINEKKGYRTVFNLAEYVKKEKLNISITFYGKIEEKDIDHFSMLLEANKEIVEYKGQLSTERIVDTLCNYDVMLFPTNYYTEGFPGTVLDAYISGIPVIATEWMHAREFIEDGKSGYIVPFENSQTAFNNRVITLYKDRTLLNKMKKESRARVTMYTEEKAWSVLKKYL